MQASAESVASDDPARVMLTVYVLGVPSCAKTLTWIALTSTGRVPSFKVTGPDAVPDATATPATVTVALGSSVVGVMVLVVVALLTERV